jgi:molecular chaperone GrpE
MTSEDKNVQVEENSTVKTDESSSNDKKESSKTVDVNKYLKALEQINNLQKEVGDWKNKYYRAYADTDNLRKSIEKDHSEALKYRAEGFVENLMPALDGFHMALSGEAKTQEMKQFLEGFSYIYRNIMSVLENEGVREIDPKIGSKFDVSCMHAIDTIEQEGPENVIVRVMGKGYMLHDKMIRPALVYVSCKVGSKKAAEETKKENIDKNPSQSSTDGKDENK